MEIDENLKKDFELFLSDPENNAMHPSDVGRYLKALDSEDKNLFKTTIEKIPPDYLGSILLELPEKLKKRAINLLSYKSLVEATSELESDDATDLVQEMEDMDASKAKVVFSKLEKEDRDEITTLKKYSDDQAGSIMQMEVFKASINESIRQAIARLALDKEEKKLKNIFQVFIVDENQQLLASAALSELITMEFDVKFKQLIQGREYPEQKTVLDSEKISEVVKRFQDYDLTYAPVVNSKGQLIGRITSDDIYDVIEDIATEQMFNLAGVDDETEQENILGEVFQKRAFWLFINLITAIIASFVIAQFDETLRAFIPLAILMPIVASMGGNAATQTLSVTVRQLTLGEVDWDGAYPAIKKEIILSLLNGLLFALVIGVTSFLWFKNYKIGMAIGLATIINLIVAGTFGSLVPLTLKRFKSDPAVGSTVIITTLTDVIGFLSFLGIAKYLLT
jgi:magnesium transporter